MLALHGKFESFFEFFQRGSGTGGIFFAARRTRYAHRADQAAHGTDRQTAFHHDDAVDVIELGANVATRGEECTGTIPDMMAMPALRSAISSM